MGAVLLAAAALLLSGCAPSDYPIFDREASEEDFLPTEVETLWTDGQLDLLERDTIRHAATWKSIELFLARDPKGGVCLVIWDGAESSMACGGAILGVSNTDSRFEVQPAPIGEKDGWIVLSENIRVEDK